MKTQTEVKHSPGPWSVHDNGLYILPSLSTRFSDPLAQTFGPQPQAGANARLIAQSPTMYTLLTEASEALRQRYHGAGLEPGERDMWKRIEAVLDAVKS